MPAAEPSNRPHGSPHPVASRRVVIVGGGVAAIEALLALRDLGEGAFDTVLVAPDERFRLRALTVAEPFAIGHADVGSLPEIVTEQGGRFVCDTVTEINTDDRLVLLGTGEPLPYDVLILAPGARARAPFPSCLTFGLGDPAALNGLLADLEHGYTNTVAFVVPDGLTWSLPLYELALMTAAQVHGMGRDVDLTLVTPEPQPLAVFGAEAGHAVTELLDEAGVALHHGVPVAVGRGRVYLLGDDEEELVVDRIVTLPLLDGPRVPGVPADSDGFIPIDEFCRVRGLEGVYAIGDAADLAVKQGGLACQQADVAATHIAEEAGADVVAEPLLPVLRGKLLTGRASRFLRRDLGESHGREDLEPLWWPPAKVVGRYLGPFLAYRQRPAAHAAPAAVEPAPSETAVDIEIPLGPLARLAPHVLGMDPLGPMRT